MFRHFRGCLLSMGSYLEAVLRLYWAGEHFLHLNNEKHKVNICKLSIFVYRYLRSYLINKHVLLNTKCMKWPYVYNQQTENTLRLWPCNYLINLAYTTASVLSRVYYITLIPAGWLRRAPLIFALFVPTTTGPLQFTTLIVVFFLTTGPGLPRLSGCSSTIWN